MLLNEIKIDGNTSLVHELEGLIKKSMLLKIIYRFNHYQSPFDLFAEKEATILNSRGISWHSNQTYLTKEQNWKIQHFPILRTYYKATVIKIV